MASLLYRTSQPSWSHTYTAPGIASSRQALRLPERRIPWRPVKGKSSTFDITEHSYRRAMTAAALEDLSRKRVRPMHTLPQAGINTLRLLLSPYRPTEPRFPRNGHVISSTVAEPQHADDQSGRMSLTLRNGRAVSCSMGTRPNFEPGPPYNARTINKGAKCRIALSQCRRAAHPKYVGTS
jgi:hypothetical protein